MELPAQNDKAPVIVGVGNGLIVVVAETVPEQPLVFVTVTLNVPAVLTVMLWVVAPVDQL